MSRWTVELLDELLEELMSIELGITAVLYLLEGPSPYCPVRGQLPGQPSGHHLDAEDGS